jgi:transposase
VTVTDVARRNGVAASLVFTWRRQAKLGQLGGGSPAPLLLPVELAPVVTDVASTPMSGAPFAEPARRSRRSSGIIEIALGSGRRLRVDRDVDAEALRRVLDVLDRR